MVFCLKIKRETKHGNGEKMKRNSCSQSKNQYISQCIQYENLQKAYCVCLLMLFLTPAVVILESALLGGWYMGNGIFWILEGMLIFGINLFGIQKEAVERNGNSRLCLYLFWGTFLTQINLFTFMARSEFFAHMLFWVGMLLFTVFALSSQKGFYIGLGTEVAVALIHFVRNYPGAEILGYHLIMFLLCVLLSKYSYCLYQQKYLDAWNIRKAHHASELDPMTHLLNRRGLSSQQTEIMAVCRRKNRPLGVMMIDIDNFKKYNDSFGHPAGDECIKRVAAQIEKSVAEKNSISARIGGEEFLVLVWGNSEKELIQVAENLKQSVEEMKMSQASDNFHPYVTISMGLFHINQLDAYTFDELYHKADESLYQAKQSGRNCIFMNNRCVSKRQQRFQIFYA